MSKPKMTRDADGYTTWHLDGKLHREDGPAFEFKGTRKWFLNGELHREDGPAAEWWDGTKMWYQNDRLHRIDGPAVEWQHGTEEWWLDDRQYLDINDWARAVGIYDTDEFIMMKLKYG